MADSTDSAKNDTYMPVRVPSVIHRRFKDLADRKGRSLSEEVRFAMMIYDAQVTLHYLLHDPAAHAELGDQLPAAVAEVERDLRGFMAAALAGKKRADDHEPVLH
jgi:hypothetical protein